MPATFTRAFSRLDESVRESLFVFLLSRGLVLVIFIVVGQIKFGAPEIGLGPSGPITARNAVVSLSHAPIGPALRETIAQGDVNAGRDMICKAIALQPAFDVVGGPEAAKLVNANATASR